MPSQGDERIHAALKKVAALAGTVAGCIGVVYFVAWISGVMTYRGLHSITIKTNTSLCLSFCALAIVLIIPEHPGKASLWASRVLASLSVLIAGATLLEYLLGWSFGIDQLVAREPAGAIGITHPNRMGLPGAVSLALCGAALLLLQARKAGVLAAQAFGVILCLIALLGMLGYLYEARDLYGVSKYTAIAWPATIAIFSLGLALLCLRPGQGLMAVVSANDAGGVAIRRLLLPALVLSVLLGWLGLQGEELGLYQRSYGTAMLVLSWIVIFSFLIYTTGKRLNTLSAAERRATEELRRTQSLLMEGESLSHTGAWEWDIKRELWNFSEEWVKIHGTRNNTLRHEELLALAHPDDRRVIEQALEALRKGEKPYRLEHRIIRQDSGEERTVISQGQFAKDQAGRVVRVFGFVQDVTEQRKAEKEIELQRQLLEAVVDHLPAGVLILAGSDLRVLVANPAYRQYAAAKEMLNKPLEEVWPEVPGEEFDIFRQVLATGEPYYAVDQPYRLARAQGGELELRYFTWSLFRVALPGPHGMGLLHTAWETTERQKSEEALRQSEERLKRVIEHMDEGMIVIDPQGGLLHWNRKALEMYEYHGNVDEVSFLSSLEDQYEIFSPDGNLLPLEQWPIARVLRGEAFRDWDICICARKRNWKRIQSVSGTMIPGPTGEPALGLLTLRDITSKKQAEEALRASEELLNKVLDTLPVAVWIMDREGNVARANRAAHSIWEGVRYVTHERYGEYKGWWVDTGKMVAPQEWAGARALTKGETCLDEEVEIECFDGSHKIILNSAVPIRDEAGAVTGAITINQDITARKRIEDALRDSEEKFRAVFQQAAVGMGTVSFTDARWIKVNDAFCRMLGYSRDEMLATPWPEITHPEDLDLDLIPFLKMSAGELESYSVEKRFIRRDGHHVWARLTLSLVRDAQGYPDFEIAVIEDVTDRKLAEEELRRAKDELELRVRGRTQELERAYSELKRETEERIAAVEDLRKNEQLLIQQSRLAAMGEMLGNIAHQWRQPLNNLGLIVQHLVLSEQIGELTPEHLGSEVSKAMQVILHMSQTINDFRNFLQEEKERHLFEVNDAVATTVSLLEATLRTADIELAIEQREKLYVNGYRNEFSQVLMNIITNARDAFRERNVASPKVLITLFKEGDRSVITVADNAGGIPQEILDRIFDPYFTTKGPDKGTGIGLFMSKNIIEKSMGGFLTARNTGAGAEFRIEL